jgi:hypothetical protein
VLMEDMGLPEFCQYAHSLDVAKLIEQFTRLERDADQLRAVIQKGNAENAQLVADQFTALDAVLFPPGQK